MPKCIREEYTGNKSKHFSTQIGYSNYPRLFNLAARPQALFQVLSTDAEFVLEDWGLGGHLSLITSFWARGVIVHWLRVYTTDCAYEFGLTNYPAVTAPGVIKCSSLGGCKCQNKAEQLHYSNSGGMYENENEGECWQLKKKGVWKSIRIRVCNVMPLRHQNLDRISIFMSVFLASTPSLPAESWESNKGNASHPGEEKIVINIQS